MFKYSSCLVEDWEKEMKPREIVLPSGVKIFLGRNSQNNDELVKKFKGKPNLILHTVTSGSPFCIIDDLKPSKKDISLSGAYCARYSQAWRDKKSDVKIHVFDGKSVKKNFWMKKGSWKLKKKPKVIVVKKRDILKIKKNA